jgi:hypothetical protein
MAHESHERTRKKQGTIWPTEHTEHTEDTEGRLED